MLLDTSMDKNIHISAVKSFNMIDVRNRDRGQTICVKSKPNIDNDKFIAELEGIMRNLRRLKPMEENDFALNEVSLIANQFDQFFIVFNMAGWIIGGFSILVGGFGIANIMFVSVKERTKIIGIQKSLGAKRYFILLQFIFEAVVLSLIGGILGIDTDFYRHTYRWLCERIYNCTYGWKYYYRTDDFKRNRFYRRVYARPLRCPS